MALYGETLINLGERARGLEEMRSALGILEAEIARTGPSDLKQVLAWLPSSTAKHAGQGLNCECTARFVGQRWADFDR